MRVSLFVLLMEIFHLTSGLLFIRDSALVLTDRDVAELLNNTDAQTFIVGFNNSYQRWVVTQQLRYCPFVPLCTFTFGLQDGAELASCCKRCGCNFPACLTSKTCCPDVLFNQIPVTNNMIITKEDLDLLTGEEIQKACIPLVFSSSGLRTRQESAYAYASCPLAADDDIEHNCTRLYTAVLDDISDIVPVMRKNSNVLYRNKYCAYCNNIPDNETQPLNAEVACNIDARFKPEKNILASLLQQKSCDIAFTAEVRTESCKLTISECNTTGQWEVYEPRVERLCELYTSSIEVHNMSFQNIFCAECNGFNEVNLQCKRFPNVPESADFSFSGLLKLSTRNSEEGPTDPVCSENQIYDKIRKECLDIFCSIIMAVSEGQCVDIYETLVDTSYIVYLRIKPIQQMSVHESYNITDEMLDHLSRTVFQQVQFCSVQVLMLSNTPYDEETIEQIDNSSLLYFDIRVKFYIDFNHDPNGVRDQMFNQRNFSVPLHNASFEINVRDGDPRPFDIIAIISKNLVPSAENSEYFGSLPLSVLIQKHAAPGVDGLSVIPYPFITYPGQLSYVDKTPLNIIWLKSCPKVNVSRSNFPWVTHADGLLIQHGNYTLVEGDFYYIDDDHIVVCVDTYRDFMSKSPFMSNFTFSAETIVSIVCSSLSIVSLVVTFVAFSVISQLRQTLPGKNSFSLVFYLLCAQCLYMVKGLNRLDTDSAACFVMGMSVHFFWLVALFWMNNCTFHMFRVLTQTKIVSHDSGVKRLTLYHMYALAMAAIFVCVNIVVSLKSSGHIGYGGNVCYISSQEMINYTFLIPTCFIVVSNITMFLIVVVKIRKTSSIQKNVQNERNDLLVFAKLSTITGATWIFGVLYTWTSFFVFSYLFILLNAFQGVFIMLAFIVNKRVYNLFKSKASVYMSSSDHTTPVTRSTKL